jgi:hypothetical protein
LEVLLESTSHVAEKAHASDFNKHLEKVLVGGVALDIPIAYRRKIGVHPIDGRDVEAIIVKLLYIEIMIDKYPPIL